MKYVRTIIEQSLLGKYFPRESEEFFQARVLVFIHITLVIMMSIVIQVTPATGTIALLMESIFLLSLSAIFFIRFGFLPVVTVITYSGMGLLATLAVFAKPAYQNFEIYALTAFHMFITVIASLLTRQQFYTYLTTIAGVIYMILLFIFRGLRMSTPDRPLEIDDYIIGPSLLIMVGYILRKSLDRRKQLLVIAENESKRSRKKAQELEVSLEEKEILIQEVHHRVKNNLNVAMSLLNLQIRKLDKSSGAIETLQDSIGRLNSMALVHERLYSTGNLNAIEFKPYIVAILHAIMRSMQRSNIEFKVNVAENITIDLAKAVPCGLIINELITNVYKHAFPSGETGFAELNLSLDNNMVTLTVKDTGVGISEREDAGDQSLGMHLVTLLAEQLGGVIKIEGHSGTAVKITFPLTEE